ncbi:MAG: molecular chaperone HtpG [Nitrosomonadales bacterium]|jgi:molecular chaperone HtpG|nr:molecular chaperone HtpG [Nitrosomonadales bacterium]MBT4570620.1 molecular chaperone HtpG [Nitrosomonadales bacterium]MBT4759657.1 molecular chaperone HtpG [Nitrosomonadales bacterium]MBT5150292.1 molecular chaperone HtpG [Nitrosomonadales bacterium]MBT6014658.1 molecular chaperone HtpG [Nitrosomonadales bacterium]
MTKKKETLSFQAEVKQLLQLMIHSLYSNKEIAVRELISNASDAADKLRFEALKKSDLYENDSELKIWVDFDNDKKTITISDNGIGMSREDIIKNIGTIAKSGTKEFLKKLSGDQAKDANLIGQFGVGFYSAFIISEEVTLESRKAGEKSGSRWVSKGDGEFSLETIDKKSRGTSVILSLKKDAEEFLDEYRLKEIIKKYSDHITLPIVMKKFEFKDGKSIRTEEDEVVNDASAIWARNKKDIKPKEYDEFYKNLTYDQDPPLSVFHNRVEGSQEYVSLLFIPSKAPFDLYDRDKAQGVKLYAKRIFIMEANEKLIPQYLRFMKGVIDSSDLPLNVSREILQDSKALESIRSGTVKKILSALEDMAKKKTEDFKKFWNEFGLVLKEGPAEDFANREKIAGLLRFSSTFDESDSQSVSLADYIGRMKPEQEVIYYITADSFLAAKNSPHLEIFKKKNIEVILLGDRVDEWLMSNLPEVSGKKFQSIAKGDLDLGKLEDESEKDAKKDIEKKSKTLVEKIAKSLGNKIKEVKVTHRLTDSPACLVVGENDISGNLERILKAAGQNTPDIKPVLEINPEHALIKKLNSEKDEKAFDEYSSVVFDQALISEGGQLEDPVGFVKRINQLLVK